MKQEAMYEVNIYETGLFRIPNEIISTGSKASFFKSRQIVEVSHDKVLVCRNVPQTASQNSRSIQFFPIYEGSLISS